MFIGFSVTIIVLWLAIDSLGLGIRCYMLEPPPRLQHCHVTKIFAALTKYAPFLAKYLPCYDVFAMLRAMMQIFHKEANIVL